jgi:lipid-binding SYLF domain-containing protein
VVRLAFAVAAWAARGSALFFYQERNVLMKLQHVITGFLVLGLAVGSAFAQTEKAKRQAEVRKAAHAALAKFYKADPKLKAEVSKAPGYGVFTTFGLSFIVGGSGGRGLVHDAKTKHDTFMKVAQASAGLQVGVAENETLIIFKSRKGMNQFIDKGWEIGGGGSLSAGAGGKTAGSGSGKNEIADAVYYTYTKNGLQGGGAVAGTKFWKDDELN